jgi:nucleotide-binding universal stress UspA family protein
MNAYRRILAAVDGSAASSKALHEAIRLARAQRARLTLLHVVNDFAAYDYLESAGLEGNPLVLLRQAGRRIVARAAAAAQKRGVKAKAVLAEIPSGAAAGAILREARRQRADLIVLGTHGRRGLDRLVMGSDAELVVRGAKVPVLVVRA